MSRDIEFKQIGAHLPHVGNEIQQHELELILQQHPFYIKSQ